ncbi:DUF2500 family protein [Paenibacillus sp. HJL G12]|uniref:DUF2500 family protein n=1 Tax=Paenibacillus dendrobii TaxID=2691084 RepID=A0A7X3IFJ1_9BACL|nr:DUF2500 domain-containing protein [Paenibacillus dendrobii]MWV42959.1 DUF2500 family protein [Paenibacillus dendrobii]
MVSPGPDFGFMFTLVPTLIAIGFIVMIVILILNGARYFKNARSPRTSTYVRIISKRMDTRHHTGGANGNVHSSRTYYYITLEFDNGERQEYLDVKRLYGLVAEGDTGYAAIQGEWIVAFEREV